MSDLLVRGGMVVTVSGSRSADVLVTDGRIEAVLTPEEGDRAAEGVEAVDASGLLVLPGVIDAHTHTRVASDAEPDRFFQDSLAAAFGGTTTFMAFNTSGTGVSPAGERSLVAGLSEWRASTASDSAIDFAPSLIASGKADDPVAELAAIVDAGVPTAKSFMVYDFRLDDRRLFEAMREMGRVGGMLQVHCEDPVLIDSAVAAALQRGDVLPRYHAATRTREAEAVATHRAMEFARAADAPVHVVHLSSGMAVEEIRRAKASGVRATAETCPHYLALTDERYRGTEAETIKFVISPPLRPAADRDALWAALADGTLDLVATDHVPDRLSVEKRTPAPPFPEISNGAPGIETLLAIVYSEGVARGRITVERMVDLLSTTPARRFGVGRKGAIEPGLDADIVLFDTAARRRMTATDLHHTSDYTPYEGFEMTGAVRSVFVRGRPVIKDGAFVGQRGFGRFVERAIASEPRTKGATDDR
ncbi:MAG TPA: dihydropyrimidinase [Candidatus Acidoferrum sp.]|nr:dihydropyrimidinase [Candidatus Acidoferrum sp.]